MKKRKGLTIKINLSNRWLYFLITLGILIIVGVGVWAYAGPSGVGHGADEIEGLMELQDMVNELGASSCSLTDCAVYNVAAYSSGDGAWTLCPSNRPVMHGLRHDITSTTHVIKQMQCCAIICS